MNQSCTVTITGPHWDRLRDHLFPGDGREHGAVLLCGILRTPSGTRLLVHDVVPAVDGTDYIQSRNGPNELTPDFVTRNILRAARAGLVYLAVHCHGGRDHVGFSDVDLGSHANGYPALVDINRGNPVGALVFAQNAVAGDIWHKDGTRTQVSMLTVVGSNRNVLRPAPLPSVGRDPYYDRQSRLFGDRGQETLRRQKIGIIGVGGAGSLLVEYHSRLGVGEIVVIDPDRIETTNLPRVVGSRRRDAWPWLTDERRSGWLRRIGTRFSATKVHVAKRLARQGSAKTKLTTIFGPVDSREAAWALSDCDQIYLAADTAVACHFVNTIAHQYLIPVTQVGAKVPVDEDGIVGEVFSAMRASIPGTGCLWCNSLISPERLRKESLSDEELDRQRYVEDEHVVAPSVITLNAVAASDAANDWLMRVTGLSQDAAYTRWVESFPRRGKVRRETPRTDPNCYWCGPAHFARGDAAELPVQVRS